MLVRRILVCGGRDYLNERKVYEVLQPYKEDAQVIIHGKAKGADFLAGQWALINNIPVLAFQAEWERFGRAAGRKRNTRMLLEGKPNLVIAFPGGAGTENMISQSIAANVQVVIIKEDLL